MTFEVKLEMPLKTKANRHAESVAWDWMRDSDFPFVDGGRLTREENGGKAIVRATVRHDDAKQAKLNAFTIASALCGKSWMFAHEYSVHVRKTG